MRFLLYLIIILLIGVFGYLVSMLVALENLAMGVIGTLDPTAIQRLVDPIAMFKYVAYLAPVIFFMVLYIIARGLRRVGVTE